MRKESKLGFLFRIVIVGFAFWWFENFTLSIDYTNMYNSKVKNDIKIVQLTDLHGQTYGSGNQKLIHKINSLNPDFIAVTGDMYTYGDDAGKQRSITLLSLLAKVYKVYFVPGEHDNLDSFMKQLSDNGVKVLTYKEDTIKIRDTKIDIYGINNMYFTDTFDLSNEFKKPSKENLTLLLSHQSNYRAFIKWGADVTLSGDTHGGIMQIPFLGPLINNDTWLPERTTKDYVFDKGSYCTNGKYMYVSSGLGNYPVPIRLFNRPEISMITVKPK